MVPKIFRMADQNINPTGNSNELLSDEVREIISYRPHWIVRKGNIIFLIVLSCMFLLTFLIQYPDIITTPARLVRSNPNILPQHTGFYAEINTAQKDISKIKIGQKVILKIDSYPTQEFGSITGTVDHIADTLSNNDSFVVKVILPQGAKTNYGKTIFLKTDLTAQASIITNNSKLFDRLAGQLKSIWQK